MQHNLVQKNVLLIGGSSGIGKQLAIQLANNYNVFSTFNRNKPEDLNVVNTSFHFLNVLDDELDLTFLPEKIDALVYCPGSITLKPFSRIAPVDFINDYKLNVIGAIRIIQEVLPKLKASGNASVILFSTVAVNQGFPFHSIVSSSKGAIEGLTKALAAELAPTVRVNCIAPSITETPLSAPLLNTEAKKEANAARHPLKRIGTVNDIANIISFLVSEDSSWITGQILAVDGGMSTIK